MVQVNDIEITKAEERTLKILAAAGEPLAISQITAQAKRNRRAVQNNIRMLVMAGLVETNKGEVINTADIKYWV